MDWIDSGERYYGNWTNDHPDGNGNLLQIDTQAGVHRLYRNRYSGEFSEGCREGLGVFYYADGSVYEG